MLICFWFSCFVIILFLLSFTLSWCPVFGRMLTAPVDWHRTHDVGDTDTKPMMLVILTLNP